MKNLWTFSETFSLHVDLGKCIERWLRKPTNTTKQNLPPFSVTGDVNDAVFPLPEYISQYLTDHVQSFLTTDATKVKTRNIFECDIFRRPIERPSPRDVYSSFPLAEGHIFGRLSQRNQPFDELSQVIAGFYPSADVEKRKRLPRVMIERTTGSVKNYSSTGGSHETPNTQQETTSRPAIRYAQLTREEQKVHLARFAQRMNENMIQFQIFCSKTTAVGKHSDHQKS